ncbi:MAG: ankyrin repeat domain-containing protein [Rhodoferax sp.]
MKTPAWSGLRRWMLVCWLAWCSIPPATAGAYDDFFRAIHADNPIAVRALVDRGFDPNTVDSDGLPALLLAFKLKTYAAAQALLAAPGIQVEVRTRQDESALMLAALAGQRALCERLLQLEADVNKTGWAPLHYAAAGGHADIIALLLEHHAYIDAESPNGTTPLMMAARYGTHQAVQALLAAGADASLKNQLGLSALDFARIGKQPDSIEALTRIQRKNANPSGEW